MRSTIVIQPQENSSFGNVARFRTKKVILLLNILMIFSSLDPC
jgi:hypothetical protein